MALDISALIHINDDYWPVAKADITAKWRRSNVITQYPKEINLIMADPIKVVLVEDSSVALEIMQRLIDSSPEVDVVGTAQDGERGLAVIAQTMPDVICTDLQMPKMDGLEFTQKVMTDFPRPILVVSNSVHPGDVDNIFNLMEAGALDFFPKPTSGTATDYEKLKSALITKIKVLASKKK